MYKRQTVYEGMAAVRLKNGSVVGLLKPGRYWLLRGRDEIRLYPLGQQVEVAGGQEVLTSDGATLRVSIYLVYRISDVLKVHQLSAPMPDNLVDRYSLQFLTASLQKPEQRLRMKAQVLLREWTTTKLLEDALAARDQLADYLREPLAAIAEQMGVTLEEVEVLEFGLTGNLRAAYSDLLKAELEGKSALQRARNEAATMRNLLNTARLVREHPGLLELRALASSQKPRVSFVVGNVPRDPAGEVQEDPTE